MRQLLTSKFSIAVIVFGALSFLASAVHLWEGKPTDYPYHSWTSWAIDDFLNQKTPPQLVFFGSSLMLVPLSGVDADYYGKPVDGAAHHYSAYFEQEFAQKTGSKIKTFNFALPGQMPSDAYLATKFLLKQDKQPSLIVYGLGPRDFMDNLLPGPSSTDPFRFFSRFGDISDIASITFTSFFDKVGYELERFNYFYKERSDIAYKWNSFVRDSIDNAYPKTQLLTRSVVQSMIPEHQPFQLEKEEAFFRPMTREDLASFTDNLNEYRKRYKTLNWQTFLTQMHFFADTLKIARDRGTHVVVVAMPITDINRELIPDWAWNLYRYNLSAVATACGASFVDFSESACFNRKDFSDTVHLHARGGRKFLDILIEQLADDETVKASLQEKRAQPIEVAGKNGSAL